MDDITLTTGKEIAEINIGSAQVTDGRPTQHGTGMNPAIITLIKEGGLSFFRYIKSLGISKDKYLVVLSAKQHYYYDEGDLRNVRFLINLKKLNMIKHLEAFLNSLVRIMPPETNFIGYFSDSNAPDESRRNKFLWFYRKLNNLIDDRTDRELDRNEVTKILKRSGFEVINMTSVNGMIYFNSLKKRHPADLKN